MRRIATLAILALALAACGDDQSAVDAAPVGDAGSVADAGPVRDGSPSLAWVDFAITGCDPGPVGPGDAGAPPPCTGPAPLSVRFTPLAPAPVNLYVWSFGDGDESQLASPEHRYLLPGTYDVTLTVGGPGGTAMVTRTGIIQPRATDLGAACTDDAQCGARDCVCDPTDGCAAPFSEGLCSDECDQTTPCTAGVCADLAPAAAGADWQRTLCLPGCTGDGDCPAGTTCQTLHDPGGEHLQACFVPGALGAIGDACVDPQGNPDGSRCASGTCADLGLRGMCTEPCTAGTCPAGSTCATFAGGSLCLARCNATQACDGDPQLACQPPGTTGPGAFTVTEPAHPAGYCAPKPCTDPQDCGTTGTCTDGYCTAP